MTEILKQALQTTITLDGQDFEKFNVQEHLHVGISVKDFRAIIIHAATVQAIITAIYSQPKKPLQLAYSNGGMQCTFTLVTMTEYLGSSIKVAQPAQNKSMLPPVSRDAPGQPRAQNLQMAGANDMPAPPLPTSRSFSREMGSHTISRPSPPPPQASINQESLFLADDDEDEDDRRWGPEYHTEDNDAVRWVCNLPRSTLAMLNYPLGLGWRSPNPTLIHRTRYFTNINGIGESGHHGG